MTEKTKTNIKPKANQQTAKRQNTPSRLLVRADAPNQISAEFCNTIPVIADLDVIRLS